MKITEAQLYTAINTFIEREIIPLGASMDMPKQFMFGFKVGVVKRKIESVVKNYLNKGELKLLEIVDENGNIDITPLYQSAMDMLNQMQKIEIGGITFRESDLQVLYSIIQSYIN